MTTPYHPPVKRSVEIAGHKTSISLEPLFWELLKTRPRARACRSTPWSRGSMHRADRRPTRPPGLAGAIRVWLVAWLPGNR